ncbi:hypothetical protein [Sphingobium lignivorans]|uniref:Uncharacterized protein n=1 Tax=Sphingobium lignivorans TaxID=2735886 RepID=A0ABR6NFY6_9SPHN|nr:hypothetical protein [Sphingobium lignivorans]MBB5985986.1 hypothetical protein [Sphingobium lignivorans]
MEAKLPADWAIERVLKRIDSSELYPSIASMLTAEDVKRATRLSNPMISAQTILVFAEYIEEHEAAPPDADLLLAREICAAQVEGIGRLERAIDYRSGRYDKARRLTAALKAIKTSREQTL